MATDQDRTPSRGDAALEARRAREADALRENLRRRKAQARAREDAVAAPDAAGGVLPAEKP